MYSYTMNKIWASATFDCNVSSADYPKCIVEFEEPLPANFKINYAWKASAEATGDPSWENIGIGNGSKTTYEFNFDSTHPYIAKVEVLHTDDVSASIKIKKLTLVSANEGNKLNIVPQFTNWGGTDNTEFYRGTVTYKEQFHQLNLNGVDGKKGVTINVKFAESNPNIQLHVDYDDTTSEYPWINGSSDFTFTTKAEVAIKEVGIQMKQENPIDPPVQEVTVNSATASYTDPTSTAVANEGSSDYWGTYSNNLTAVKLSDDVEVYNVTLSNEANKLVFTKRADNKVAKGEGVIVKSHSESFGVEVINDDLDKAEGNFLKATPTTDQKVTDGDNKLYKLAFRSKNDKTSLGFYWGSEDGKSIESIPGKAYLSIPASKPLSLRSSIVIGDSETTSIIGAKAERVNQGDIYNLAGQRVNRLTKGVNILGNKKVLVK